MTAESKPYLDCPTGVGTRSIFEAAAGTGKTYSITRIVARLIMERETASIKNMVIVTFTRAAAAELKNRISTLLGDLERRLDPKMTDDELKRKLASSPDEDDKLLLKALEAEKTAPAQVKGRLRRALLDFDQAIIGTIHSFALRVLTENGFGSGMKLDFTLNEKTDPILRDLCNDYFRSLLFKFRTREERALLEKSCGLNVDVIFDCVRARSASPELRAEIPGAEHFRSVDEAIAAALKPPRGKTTSYRAGVVEAACNETYAIVSEKFKKLAEKNNFLSQDDLIFRLRDALKEKDFRDTLRGKYHIGLIDEFQDTSAAQFDIFESLFLENSDSTFIVVGDPRQAIYRFRNCDLATYLTAREKIGTSPIPMSTNYRSGKKYIDVLNSIFKRTGTFALDDMDMPTQHAPDPEPPETMEPQVLWDSSLNEVTHPIQVVWEPRRGLDYMLKRCAQDIAAMLNAGYRIPPKKKDGEAKPLESGDIAVLVARWKDARFLRDELLERNVPAVALQGEDIFGTPEAEELLRFLEGILDPEHGAARLRALITPLGDLEDLSDLKDEKKTAAGVSRLRKLGEVWRNRSFGVMYGELLREFRVCDRLNSLGGRRKLGKYNVIADYLAEVEFSRKLPPSALCRELWACIEIPGHAPELAVPPETDRGAVVIDTVFGSKGLTYPVVFLPDLFYRGQTPGAPCRCHEGTVEHLIPYQPKEKRPQEAAPYVQREDDEEIQEDLRKAYVAFTRARYYCRFYYGHPGRQDPGGGAAGEAPEEASPVLGVSALDWLFRRPRDPQAVSFSGLAAQMTGGTFLPEPAFGEVEVISEPPAQDGKTPPPSLEPLRRPDLLPEQGFSRGFLSFSALYNPYHVRKNAFAPENDEGNAPPADDSEGSKGIFKQFPGGAAAFGTAVHALLEEVDFASDKAQLEEAVGKGFRDYSSCGEKMKERVVEMLWNTFHSPLRDAAGGIFRLCDIAPDRKKSEFGFLCQFDGTFRSSDLFDRVRTYFSGRFGCREVLPFAPDESFSKGFFNGSIDLFFEYGGRYYIVDWKTNDLKSYSPKALAEVMGKEGYCLQYLIYTAALFKYLKLRCRVPKGEEKRFYDEHFGGVHYLFVRGMAPELPGSGVFYDKPPCDICERMEGFIG